MNLQSTDPEYTQRLGAFLEEVRNEPDSMLEPTTRWLAILATLTGSGSVDAYKEALPQALQEGLDPVAVKEMVYQATDYLGYGRALPFLPARTPPAPCGRSGARPRRPPALPPKSGDRPGF